MANFAQRPPASRSSDQREELSEAAGARSPEGLHRPPGICDGAAIAFRQPSFAIKLHRITKVEHLTSSRTIANTLLAAGNFWFLV